MKYKKIILVIILIVIIAIAVFILVNSTSDTADNPDTNNLETPTTEQSRMINIRENMFLTQVEDVHINISRYGGRPISLEGAIVTGIRDGEIIHGVGRSAPRLLWR